MQRIKSIQNHDHQVLHEYHQQQQHQQGYQQQQHQQGYQEQAYNTDLTYQGLQEGLNHQFQNHQLQNYRLKPQEIQTAQLPLHQIQAPQLQYQIQEQIVHQIQPQSHGHEISVALQPPAHQELQVQFEQTQLPQTQSHQSPLSYQIPSHQTDDGSNKIQQFQEKFNHGLSYGGQKQGRPGDKSAKIVGYKFEKGGPNYRFAYETENGEIFFKIFDITQKLVGFHYIFFLATHGFKYLSFIFILGKILFQQII